MTPVSSPVAAALPPWGLRFTAPIGRLPLGAVFGTIGALGAGAVALLGLDHLPVTVCLFKGLTGIPCPTCGSTRAVGRLVHLDVAGALAMNPLTTLAAALVAIWAVADLGLLARGRALDLEVGRPLARLVRGLVVAAVAVNWLYLVAAGR
jgi:Protein of unknown function (DUF2752)